MSEDGTGDAEKRILEVSDPEYTAGYLSYGDTEIPTCIKGASRQTLSPKDFDIVNDEDLTYQNLFVSDQNADRFQPPKQSGDPSPDVYLTRDEEFQIRPEDWIDTDCICADGSKARGKKNTRTGKIDCNCNKSLAKNPNVYKPVKNKPRIIDTKPLKAQAGVSYMGNVNLDVCDTFDNETIERANATLNDVVQVGKENSKQTNRQATNERIGTNMKQNNWNIYDKCNYKLYGV